MRIPYQNQTCYVSSPFGERTLNGKKEFHKGIDLVGVDGAKTLIAPCSGTVAVSTIVPQSSGNLTWQWGNYVRIDTDDGYNVYMCHMASRIAKVGQRVSYGTPVGIQGNTGYSFGSHCHFEVRKGGVSINPAPLLGIDNIVGVYKDTQGLEFAVGDQIYFSGTKQYSYSQGTKATAASECYAKITALYASGKHPYHVVGDGVYGWVDKADVHSGAAYKARVTCYKLNIRSGAGVGFPITGYLTKGQIVLITKEANNGWGKLQSGDGWINLGYTEKV